MNQQLAAIGEQRINDHVAQPLQKFTTTAQKPSMGAKLSKVAEIFELDIIDEVEALKACQVIIEQHTKKENKHGYVE